MEGGGARPAALSAAVLGSRNARRQVQAAMAHAAEYGAYSVGFSLGRGCLTGFTIYLAGNFAGCGAGRAPQGMAATCAVQPPTARDRALRQATRSRRRAPLRRAGSVPRCLVMNTLSNHKTLFCHIVLHNHKTRPSARADAGRVNGAAHDTQRAVACRR